MKKLCLICMAAFALAVVSSSAQAQWATLKGQFVFGEEGTKVPSAIKLNPTKNLEVCGTVPLFDESLVVNPKNRGIQNILLWVTDKGVKIHPGYSATDGDVIVMNNTVCRFDPHVALVRTTQTFRIGNTDPIGHNSLINFLKNLPVNPIIPGKGFVDFKLTKPELIPSKVSCSIHPWMTGVVLVQDHPYMAVTDEDGKFEIKDLPAGKLTIRLWQEKIGYVKGAKIDGKKTMFRRGRYTVNLQAGKTYEHKYVVDAAMFK